MAGSETLDIVVNLKGTGTEGLKNLQDEIKKTIASVKTGADTGVAGLKSLHQEMQKLTSTASKAGSFIKNAFTVIGIAFTGREIIKQIEDCILEFAKLDDVLRQVKAISGASGEQFREMGELVEEMGNKTRFSAIEAATTLKLLVMGGMSAADAMRALYPTMTLAGTGMIDLNGAAVVATKTLQAFGLTVDQLSSLNNVLVRASKQTGMSISDLESGLTNVAPLAHSLGADFEDLVGAIGRLHVSGMRGSQAMAVIKSVMDTLINPTAEEEKLLMRLSARLGGIGLQLKDSSGRFIGFVEIIKQLERAGLTTGEALRLFGQRAGPGMAALLGQGSAKLVETVGYLRELSDEAKKTADETETGLGGALRMLGSAAESVRTSIGAIFGEDIRQLVIYLKDQILKLVEQLKHLRDSGTLTGWAEDVKAALTSIGALIDFAILGPIKLVIKGLIELTNTARGAASVVRGELSLSDFAKASAAELDMMLRNIADNPQIAKWRVQLKELEKEIAMTQKKISMSEALSQTEMDVDTSVEEQKEKLAELQEAWKKLAIQITDYGKTAKETGKEVPPFQRADFAGVPPQEAPLANIGRAGVTSVPTSTEETPEQKRIREARMKGVLAQAEAEQKAYMALLENTYQTGLIAYEKNVNERIIISNQFYEAQKQAAIKAADNEIGVLEELAKREIKGSAERIKLDSDIIVKKEELNAKLVQLETKRYEDEYRLAEEAKQKKKQLDDTMADIRIRTEAAGIQPELERQQKEEELRLADKHRREMEALKELTNDEAKWNELARAQELEKQRLHEDQVTKMRLMQLDVAKQVFGGIDDLMTNLYEASGKKIKAFFYIAKAAAIAQATINIAEGITKAIAQGGLWGVLQGAAVAAAGAAQLSRISSQQMAVGGLVRGQSPSPVADDKLIAATAGEYMHPVKAVQYYGVGFMNAVRTMRFPKDIAAQFATRFPVEAPKRMYAEGGLVRSAGTDTSKKGEKGITINNILDPNLFAQYLASAPGERQLVNVISNNALAVRTAIFGNG